ncbi:protein of unknown function [Candidatus Nitrosotalea okcheonensis]|uniref:Uncharacterized protein n=1 Tax=Candidatus Nitrosotalea okcheonensis TaxID=1903276 RepID=A0A2H1FCG1_9ARCH|nr:protein of unknown function [Candidatus Nitrosotalea okcheonensis]
MRDFSYQEYFKSYKCKEKNENMSKKNKEKEDFLDEPSENNDDTDEFLDDEFEEELDSEKS